MPTEAMMTEADWNTFLAALPAASPLPFALHSRPCCRLDLSDGNPALQGFDPGVTADFSAFIDQQIAAAGADYAAGGYGENRTLYAMSPVFSAQDDGSEPRTLHLGVDLWLRAGTGVHAVLPGRVHSCQDNAAFGDYGPTLIVQHTLAGRIFYTLYGHLARESLDASPVGRVVEAGDVLGWLGAPEVNVGWPPHLHFQIITDLLDYVGDYPGVCRPSEAAQWLARCPDPNLLLRLSALAAPAFQFYEIVRITSANPELAEIHGQTGAILGRGQDDQGRFGYAVFIDRDGVCWSIDEHDLEATGQFSTRADYYDTPSGDEASVA